MSCGRLLLPAAGVHSEGSAFASGQRRRFAGAPGHAASLGWPSALRMCVIRLVTICVVQGDSVGVICPERAWAGLQSTWLREERDMSEQQVLVERLFDQIINKGNLDVADELFASDYVDHGPMGEMRGIAAFKEVVSMWRAAVPDVRCTIENWFESGEMAAWNVRVTGTHTGEMMGIPATGRAFEYVTPNIGRFSAGKAAEHWADQGMFQFLTQIGALGQPAPAT